MVEIGKDWWFDCRLGTSQRRGKTEKKIRTEKSKNRKNRKKRKKIQTDYLDMKKIRLGTVEDG